MEIRYLRFNAFEGAIRFVGFMGSAPLDKETP
jgi:hypothetical protein